VLAVVIGLPDKEERARRLASAPSKDCQGRQG
jgi:hypothetical protein